MHPYYTQTSSPLSNGQQYGSYPTPGRPMGSSSGPSRAAVPLEAGNHAETWQPWERDLLLPPTPRETHQRDYGPGQPASYNYRGGQDRGERILSNVGLGINLHVRLPL